MTGQSKQLQVCSWEDEKQKSRWSSSSLCTDSTCGYVCSGSGSLTFLCEIEHTHTDTQRTHQCWVREIIGKIIEQIRITKGQILPYISCLLYP